MTNYSDSLIEKLRALPDVKPLQPKENARYHTDHVNTQWRKRINDIIRQHTDSGAALKSGDINAPEHGESIGCEESGRTTVRSGEICVITEVRSAVRELIPLQMSGDKITAQIMEVIKPYLRTTEPKYKDKCPNGCSLCTPKPVSLEDCTKALVEHEGREWDDPILNALTTGMSLTLRDRYHYKAKAVLDAAEVAYV